MKFKVRLLFVLAGIFVMFGCQEKLSEVTNIAPEEKKITFEVKIPPLIGDVKYIKVDDTKGYTEITYGNGKIETYETSKLVETYKMAEKKSIQQNIPVGGSQDLPGYGMTLKLTHHGSYSCAPSGRISHVGTLSSTLTGSGSTLYPDGTYITRNGVIVGASNSAVLRGSEGDLIWKGEVSERTTTKPPGSNTGTPQSHQYGYEFTATIICIGS